MNLEADHLYEAVRSRDARFDGRFFTGVVTTGVYCRPICPAPTPRRGNVRFFACAAAAEAAGFRPCRRCRPETAPGTPAWDGTSVTVTRALRLIAGGALESGDARTLTGRLGVGERHLRRLFLRHLGATPGAIARSRRVHLARMLIDQTSLPMTEIALASGFRSVKRFNTVILETFGRSPSGLRAASRSGPARATPVGSSSGDDGFRLRLAYRPPYDWDAMLAYLSARAIPGVEIVAGDAYRRTIRVGDVAGVLEAAPAAGATAIDIRLPMPAPIDLAVTVGRVRRLLDLDADPIAITAHLRGDPDVGPAVRARPGRRLAGAWDGFELAVRAILGQQVSVRSGSTLAGRLVASLGLPLPGAGPDGPSRLFPPAATVAGSALRGLGLPASRADAVRELARRVAAGTLALTGNEDVDATRSALVSIPGVGEWTADYIILRVFGEPDTFLPTDLGVRRALAAGGHPVSPAAATARAESWRPWRAYAMLHLWTVGSAGRVERNSSPC